MKVAGKSILSAGSLREEISGTNELFESYANGNFDSFLKILTNSLKNKQDLSCQELYEIINDMKLRFSIFEGTPKDTLQRLVWDIGCDLEDKVTGSVRQINASVQYITDNELMGKIKIGRDKIIKLLRKINTELASRSDIITSEELDRLLSL